MFDDVPKPRSTHYSVSFWQKQLSFVPFYPKMFSQAKQKRIRAEIKAVWAEVNRLKEIADMKREVRAARDAKNA